MAWQPKTVAMIRGKGGQASCECVDVTKSSDVQQMVLGCEIRYVRRAPNQWIQAVDA